MTRYFLILSFLYPIILFADYTQLDSIELEKRLKSLNYDKAYKVDSFKLFRMKRNYKIFKVKLLSTHPWTKKELVTEFYYYKSKEQTPRPLMIIIPPVVYITPFYKIWAQQFFAKNGYNVFILKYNEKINDNERPLSDINRTFVSIMTSARLLLDYSENEPSIDSRRIGAYGMSLGAILSAIFVGIDKRVDAGVLIVGGGNLPEILQNSVQGTVRRFREAKMEMENLETPEEFKKAVEKNFSFDPLFFAGRRSKEDVYMVLAMDDTAVPSKNQMELWRAFNQPGYMSFPGQHFPVILKNLFKHAPIYKYLEERLGKEIKNAKQNASSD
jgi:dienelactone hydrolase